MAARTERPTAREALAHRRDEVRRVLAQHGVARAGVFGSVARGGDGPHSDLDLIVSFRPGARRDMTLIEMALTDLLGLHVDVVDAERVLDRARRTGIGATIVRETIPL